MGRGQSKRICIYFVLRGQMDLGGERSLSKKKLQIEILICIQNLEKLSLVILVRYLHSFHT